MGSDGIRRGERPGAERPGTAGGAWRPPPEARGGGSLGVLAGRTVALVVVLLLGWYAFGAVTQVLFTPRLMVEGVVLPEGPVPAADSVTVGLRVRNARWRDGAAYVVAVLSAGGAETEAAEIEAEGPVVDVPSRATVPVEIDLALPPGGHVLTLVLYDAWRENVRVDARHGLSVQVGASDVRAVRTDLPRRLAAGETAAVTVWATNAGEIDEKIVPIAVFLPEDGGRPREIGGRSSDLAAGAETVPVRIEIPGDRLDPGRYHATVRFLAPDGRKLGPGLYRLPVEVR